MGGYRPQGELSIGPFYAGALGTICPVHDRPVLVLGGTGLAGTAIAGAVASKGDHVLAVGSVEADLREPAQVEQLFRETEPKLVIHAAGRVGGIEANLRFGLELGLDNTFITANVLRVAEQTGVERLIYLGSGCCYPSDRSYKMGRADLFCGPVEDSSRAYALAKSLGVELMVRARKEGRHWSAVIPANLYGPKDNFSPERSHVVAALIRRFHDAREAGAADIELWGTGRPVRQFLHAADLGSAVAVICAHLDRLDDVVNVAGDSQCSIAELAMAVSRVVGYEGRIVWDSSRPDGQAVKLLDDDVVRALGWQPARSLDDGLAEAYDWFLTNVAAASAGGSAAAAGAKLVRPDA